MICNKCGNPAEDGLTVCPVCGEVLAADEEIDKEIVEESVTEESESAADPVTDSDIIPEDTPEFDSEDDPEEAVFADDESEEEFSDNDEIADETEPVRRSRWTWLTTVIVAATAVIVLGLVGFLGYHEGWFDSLKPKARSSCTIGDYSKIEVLKSATEVSEEDVDGYINMLLVDYPEDDLTDEWCSKYAADVLGMEMSTVDEFRSYIRDYIGDYALHSQMLEYLRSITEIKSYDEETMSKLIEYSDQGLEYYANAYGMSKEALVQSSGYSSVADYEADEAKHYMDSIIMLDKIAKDLKLTYTQEQVDEDLQRYMNMNGMSANYTLEEFKEASGETWCYLYEHMQFQSDFVMEALEDRIVYLEESPE